ncbi:hypothetical protein DYB32_010239 [Aphanomyces invadans]|uniref:DUF4833 domain-containing protein n=1 Tax=Aphanomyces invadans TaxID=157072 RepID=A0A3R6ZHD3_9STRA|nr:hypothetical protein DYB32_010239 [Aphanomyces invadans]
MLPPQSAPTKSLWVKLPPKTYCSRNTLSDAFLLRRKAGLEGFLSAAIDMLMNPKNTTGPIHKRTLTQMHVLREFLGIPAARDVQGAVRDAKRLGLTSDGWTLLESVGPHDHTFEQRCDGFNTIKRVAMVPFPPRAIFDLLVLPPHQAAAFNPTIVGGSLVRKESTSLWVEHVQLKVRTVAVLLVMTLPHQTVWFLPGVECVNVKSWRLEPNGTIIVVSIPAAECPPHVTASAQNVLTGWILSPVDATSTSVTMVTQMDLKGHIGPNSPWNKLALRNYAMDLTYLRCHLDESYDKAYYDALGPLVSPDELHAVTLHPHDMQIPGAGDKDPKVFVVCQQIEPLFCLLIHKNTNRNALILKLNVTNDDDAQTLHMTDPLVGEWVMFEKAKNPRQSMSAIERNTTYQWTTKHLGQGVHAIQFGMLKGRTFQLRNHAGYFLHGTLNGNPNVMLKRFYLTFAPSMVGLGQLEKIELVGETETEVVYVR